MFQHWLLPQSLYTLRTTQITEASYKNCWRWHDAEYITEPLDNRAERKQPTTENNRELYTFSKTCNRKYRASSLLRSFQNVSLRFSRVLSPIHAYALWLSWVRLSLSRKLLIWKVWSYTLKREWNNVAHPGNMRSGACWGTRSQSSYKCG